MTHMSPEGENCAQLMVSFLLKLCVLQLYTMLTLYRSTTQISCHVQTTMNSPVGCTAALSPAIPNFTRTFPKSWSVDKSQALTSPSSQTPSCLGAGHTKGILSLCSPPQVLERGCVIYHHHLLLRQKNRSEGGM